MKTRLLLAVVLIPLALTSVGCASFQNSLERNAINFTDKPAKVTCFSGGKVVYETTTQGKVTDSPESDGFFFKDANGTFVEINADCLFEYK